MALEPCPRILEGIGVVDLLEAHVVAARVAQQAPYRGAARRGVCHDPLGAGKADEGIAAEALASHDRLEQVRVRAIGKLYVHGERRVEVRARFGNHRDARVALRGELLEFVLSHDLLPLHFGSVGETACGLDQDTPPSRAGRA